jgi:lipopolysaccharide transport system permease protein
VIRPVALGDPYRVRMLEERPEAAALATSPSPVPASWTRVVRIERRSGLRLPDLRELLGSGELLVMLATRDIKVRYKQTVLGVLWAVIQPFMTMVVFTLVFSRVGKVGSDNVPYPVFSLAGLVMWNYFSSGLVQGSTSLTSNIALLTKVYFPRLLIPIGTLVSAGIDLAIGLVFLGVVMAIYGVAPPLALLWLPVPLLVMAMTTLGVSAGFGALNVKYRDVRLLLPFLAQMWLFLTPVAYPAKLVSHQWRVLLGLNPMAGVVETFRWAVLGTDNNPFGMLAVSFASSVVILVVGTMYFAKVERGFADVA